MRLCGWVVVVEGVVGIVGIVRHTRVTLKISEIFIMAPEQIPKKTQTDSHLVFAS